MEINAPCLITARLLPGVKIGDSWLSVEYGDYTPEGRMQYVIYLDTPQGEYVIDDICSGCQGGSLQQGLEACLSFMSACEYEARTGKRGENADLFAPEVAQWCVDNRDEIDMMQCELSEIPDLIDEGHGRKQEPRRNRPS